MIQSAIDVIVEHDAIAALPYWTDTARLGVPPHVTLLYPWRTPPVDDASVRELAAVLRPFEPWTLSITGRVDVFDVPLPHLTLAKCGPSELARVREEVTAAVVGVLPLTLRIAAIAIEQEADAGTWSVTHRIPLRPANG